MVKARRLRGQALLLLGDASRARDELRGTAEMARALGNPTQLWKTLGALAAAGEPGAGAEASAVLDAVAAGLPDGALREAFLGAPEVRRLRGS
jgi:hypothetical protein